MKDDGQDALEDLAGLELRQPVSPEEWDRYFDLRWLVLRSPWDQPRGSERDELEAESVHLALWGKDRMPVAIGRIHLNSPAEAQVRFMAVAPAFTGRGLGSRILAALELQARELGAETIVLNSRAEARGFYERHGYVEIGAAATLFGTIPHFRMSKEVAR